MSHDSIVYRQAQLGTGILRFQSFNLLVQILYLLVYTLDDSIYRCYLGLRHLEGQLQVLGLHLQVVLLLPDCVYLGLQLGFLSQQGLLVGEVQGIGLFQLGVGVIQSGLSQLHCTGILLVKKNGILTPVVLGFQIISLSAYQCILGGLKLAGKSVDLGGILIHDSLLFDSQSVLQGLQVADSLLIFLLSHSCSLLKPEQFRLMSLDHLLTLKLEFLHIYLIFKQIILIAGNLHLQRLQICLIRTGPPGIVKFQNTHVIIILGLLIFEVQLFLLNLQFLEIILQNLVLCLRLLQSSLRIQQCHFSLLIRSLRADKLSSRLPHGLNACRLGVLQT